MNPQIFIRIMLLAATCGYIEAMAQQNNPEILPGQGMMANPVYLTLSKQQISQGKQYQYSYPEIVGNQYLDEAIYRKGTLTFDGVTYPDILLNYDIYNDLVLTAMVREGLTENIILEENRIEQFQIIGQHFIKVEDSTGLLVPGIYKLAFKDQNITLHVRVKKEVVASNQPGGQLRKFILKNTYILTVAGETFNIEKKKDLYRAFSDQPEMIPVIKKSRIQFRRNQQTEAGLIGILDESDF